MFRIEQFIYIIMKVFFSLDHFSYTYIPIFIDVIINFDIFIALCHSRLGYPSSFSNHNNLEGRHFMNN